MSRRARRIVAISCAVSLTLMMLVVALAAPADLDTTFDTDGKVLTDFADDIELGTAVVIQPDGKIVVAGSGLDNFAIARYNPNGSLDTTFNGNGKVMTDFNGWADDGRAIALQPDGKILVAGYAVNVANNKADFGVARYNTDGSLDTSFDTDGKVTTTIGALDDIANAVVVQPDGKIVVAGLTRTATNGDSDYAIVRYNPNGSLDTTFNTTGKATANLGTSTSIASALALQRDGKIVAAGETGGNFAIARYNPNGLLDTSFDTDGKVVTDLVGSDAAYGLVIQPDGKLLLAGYSLSSQAPDFALARYNPNGSLDTSFDADGIVKTDFNPINDDRAYAVALQPDGKIVAAGGSGDSTSSPSNHDFAIARYNPNGSLDTTFDTDGKVTTGFNPFGFNYEDVARGVAIQPDGRIVAAGYSFSAFGDFALARYTGDPRPNEVANFDTDQKTDVAIWNPTNRNWYIQDSTTNTTRTVLDWGNGSLGDKAVPGDYDGDGKADVAIFRPSEGNWYIIRSSDNTTLVKNWGGTNDTPVPGDYDLDGKTDVAVWRGNEGNWYILNSRDNTTTLKGWGTSTDKPVPADYDGDGATDIAVYRAGNGNWYIITSRDSFSRIVNWGNSTDKPVPADYDGDGRADTAVFRDGTWYIRHWTNTATVKGWGNPTDTPVPADYDGDGKADIAIWRPSDLNWYILQSATNTARLAHITQPGVPIPSAYLPQ